MAESGHLKRPLNVWLDSDADALLDLEKARTKKSKAALINEAVRAQFGGKPGESK